MWPCIIHQLAGLYLATAESFGHRCLRRTINSKVIPGGARGSAVEVGHTRRKIVTSSQGRWGTVRVTMTGRDRKAAVWRAVRGPNAISFLLEVATVT